MSSSLNPTQSNSLFMRALHRVKSYSGELDIESGERLLSTESPPKNSPVSTFCTSALSYLSHLTCEKTNGDAEGHKPVKASEPTKEMKNEIEEFRKILLDRYDLDPKTPPGTYTAREFMNRQEFVLKDANTERAVVDAAVSLLAPASFVKGRASVITSDTVKDLALIQGSKKDPNGSVLGALNRTHTLAGYVFTAARICQPTTNIDLLKSRQQVLEEAKDLSEEVKEVLEGSLKILANSERDTLSYHTRAGQHLPGRADRFYSRSWEPLDRLINEHRHILTGYASIEVVRTAVATALVATAMIAMPAYALSLTGALGEGAIPELLAKYSARFSGSMGPLYLLASLLPIEGVKAGSSLIGAFFAILAFKTVLEWNRVELEFDQLIHGKVQSVADYYKGMKAIYEKVSGSDFGKELEEFHKLKDFMENPHLKELFSALESNTFKGEKGICFYARGDVLYSWRKMETKEFEEAFAGALAAVSEIDAVMGIAKLLGEGAVSFPSYKSKEDTNKKPYTKLVDYRHPIIPREKAILNSIELGGDKPQNLIVTGSNAGGKSTSLRAIATAFILAQSLSVTCSKEAILVIFDEIISCMQTKDNISDGDSLFVDQVKKANKLIEKGQDHNRVMALFLDELFNGTNPIEGPAFAEGIAQVLMTDCPSAVTLFATHFKNVTELQEQCPGSAANYCVARDASGNPTYKLQPGISEVMEAMQAAKDILPEKILNIVQEKKDKILKKQQVSEQESCL